MQCFTDCSQDTQIAINDTQFDNRLICRSFEYYVNPDSESIVELGTKDYPYKQLSYVLIEILNYHAHTDHNLTVYLMEQTSNILGFKQGHYINITNVSIIPYSLTSSEPEKATILVKDEVEVVTEPGTQFNIMKTFEMRIDEQILSNTDITEEERVRAEFNDYNILVIRSSCMFENLNIISDRADLYNDVSMLFLIYIQHNTISYKDIHFSVSGTISLTYDPFNMNLINIDVDYHRNLGGFEQVMFCNYPEAAHNTTIFADNLTLYYAQDRAVNPIRKQALRNQQPGNLIVNNYRSEVYLTPNEPYGILAVYLTNE